MSEQESTSTFVIRLTHDPADGVIGVIERVRTGGKRRFVGREALLQLIEDMLVQPRGAGEEAQP